MHTINRKNIMKAITKFNNTLFILFSLTLFTGSAAFAKDSLGIMDKFDAKKIAEHTWVILGPVSQPSPENKGFMNNPVFVITEKSVVVIDPGSSLNVGRALLLKIRKQTDKPITHVFNSHVHGDHWLGNHAIHEENPDVKIYAHPEMIEEAKAGEAESWISLMKTLTKGATDGTEAIIPSIALEDGQIIKIDNISIKAHLSEFAHTKTDAMFEILEDKILVTGDNAFNKRMPRLDDGSFVGNMEAMDKGLSLDITVVVPGHGSTGGKEILSNFRDFLHIIYDTSKTLLDDDMEAFEMKPLIVSKLKAFQQWDSFDDTIGKLISIAVLEAETE